MAVAAKEGSEDLATLDDALNRLAAMDPRQGQIVELRYLYAYPGGSLFQPVFLGLRDDITAEGCTLNQLKLKSAESDTDG